jgi:hypothetical protein
VDCEKVSLETMLQAFSDASKMSINPPPGMRPRIATVAPELFSLHLQDKPLLEGLLQMESQGLSFNRPAAGMPQDQPRSVEYDIHRTVPGVWSITGPFAFIITEISHTVMLDREGKPGSEWAGRGRPLTDQAGDTMQMQLEAYFEPKLKILRYPGELALVEVVDELGHSLIPAANAPVRTVNRVSNYLSPLRTTLAYPQDAGRVIKTLRGTAKYALQLDSIPVQIDDPMNTLPVEKTINGVTMAIGPGKWINDQTLSLTVTYKRGNFAGDWAAQTQTFTGIKPQVATADKRTTVVSTTALSVNGDKTEVSYSLLMPASPMQPGKPAINAITFDIPTGMMEVAVPVEFHDLPLP